MNIENAIRTYQCTGCVNGPYPTCFEQGSDNNIGCKAHCAGTFMLPFGKMFLGLPKGFCRLGKCENTKVNIYESPSNGWDYDKFNIPVWKHLDEHGNTLIRGLSPRINNAWIHIFLGDHRYYFKCLEITKEDLEGMD